MIFDSKGNKVENSVGVSDSFKIKQDDPKLFMLLSDGIYADKIAACIREISCNAYDSHVESGQKRPFLVTLPSPSDPVFKVRDFGKGLTPDQMEMYTTYGDSSKTKSNSYIGAFGIGAKSPFAYTNTFNVTTFQKGKAYVYTMFVDKGFPNKTLLAVQDTDEPSGLEVSFSVKDKDISEFTSKAMTILKWMHDKVEIVCSDSYWKEEFASVAERIHWTPAPYLGDNFAEMEFEISNESYGSDLKVVQGNVQYSISYDECNEAFQQFYQESKDSSSYFKVKKSLPMYLRFSGTLKVPNGTFMPQPSRERISFTPETKEKLGSILYLAFVEKITNHIEDIMRKAQNSYVKLYRLLKAEPEIIKQNSKFKDLYFKGYNHLSFTDWKKQRVYNLRALKISPNTNQASIINVKETMVSAVIEGEPFYCYWDGKFLSFEKKCRILEDLTNSNFSEGTIAWILFGDTTAFLSEVDLAEIKNVSKLPKSSDTFLKKWASSSSASVPGVVSIIYPDGTIKRSSNIFKDNTAPTPEEITYTFWYPAEKAYKVHILGKEYDFEYKSGRTAFSDKYRNWMNQYIDKHVEETNTRFYGSVRLLLLPDNHPLRNVLPKFEDKMTETVEYYVNKFEQSLDWTMDYRSKDYLPFVKKLYEKGLLDKLDLPQDKVDKYTKWFSSGAKASRERHHWTKPDGSIPVSKDVSDKIAEIEKSILENKFILDLVEEIVEPVSKNFVLVNLLLNSYYYRDNEAVVDETINYIEMKISTKVEEEKIA